MTEITFKSGRVFHIKDDVQKGYILMKCRNEEDNSAVVRALLDTYMATEFRNISDYIKPFHEKHSFDNIDYDIVEDCLFKDVEEYGEEELCRAMADFRLVMFCAENGLAVPGGAVPW